MDKRGIQVECQAELCFMEVAARRVAQSLPYATIAQANLG